MRIGVHLDSSTGDIQATTAAAARSGVHGVWSNQAPGGWDPLTLLTAVSDGPAELGTAVVQTYPRHPVALATQALTTQAITGGRLTLGVGPSHEFFITGQYGIPYASPARHTREYLEVLRPLLRGEHVKYSGKFFTVDTQLAVKAPEPPVLLSALGPRMLEVARDLADGTIALWMRPETISGYLVPALGDGARIAVGVLAVVTSDPQRVKEEIARDYAVLKQLPAYSAVFERGGISGAADTVIAGDEEFVAREVATFADAGVTDLLVTTHGSPEDRARTIALVAQLD